MPTTVISADNLSTTTNLNTEDASVVINSTLSALIAVSVGGNNISLLVNGSILGFGTDNLGLGTAQNLFLVNHGTISGDTAIAFNRGLNVPFLGVTLNVVINDGTIRSDGSGHAAIEDNLFIAGASTIQQIYNTGQIIGEIGLSLGSKDSLTDNGGLIVGTGGTAITSGDDNDVVRNSGIIDGAILLGNGINSIENHGTINGNITTGTGADTLLNTGKVRGNVNLGDTAGSFRNTNLIDGSVTMGGHDDIFINTGIVRGAVGLGNGGNTFQNSGVLEGSVTAGISADIFSNSGTIKGTANLGDGSNDFQNEGVVEGGAVFGTGSDTLRNSGAILLSVVMGSGTNIVVNIGQIGRGQSLTPTAIGFGANADSLDNGGDILGGVDMGDGADIFDNSGTVRGDIDLGDGLNTFTNSGLIDGDVTLGVQADTFSNAGEIRGQVSSVGGADIFFNYGLIRADHLIDNAVFLGADGDKFTNFGTIFGAVILGDGDDLFDTSAGTFHGLVRGLGGDDTIMGSDRAEELFGDADDDSLFGNGGDDELFGDVGNDTLAGGLGSDTLDGGTGAFGENDDVASYEKAATAITASLTNSALNTGEAAGDIFIDIEGLKGSNYADTLIGDANRNNLFGGNGNDSLFGGAGNADFLSGGEGDDFLDGGTGNDALSGQAGSDTYIVDDASDFIFESSALAGTDRVFARVSYALDSSAQIEAMLADAGATGLTLTGNGFAQTITGGAGKDTLLGGGAADTLLGGANDDRLDGGTAADTMSGQTGRDTYLVDNAGDLIIETASPEIDTALISINYTLSAAAQVEAIIANAGATGLALTGNIFAQSITGAGGKDTLNGGAGNDTLDGGLQADQLNGQTGSDTYIVDNAGDVVTETTINETDTVLAKISYALGAAAQIEVLTANAGTTGLALTGNGFAQTITGGLGKDTLSGAGGNDTLLGGLGADTLNGGAGLDKFVFNTALGPTNIDRIVGFVHDLDLIQLDDAIFKKIGAKLDAAEFHAAAGAKLGHDASDRIIYDTATGRLYFDIDGNRAGGKAAVLFATLDTKPLIDAGDFAII